MNQSYFSLGFLSQNSLCKLSTFGGYKGLYIVVSVWNTKRQFFPNRAGWRLGLATSLSREFQPRVNCLASLGLLSYSAPAGITLQLPACLARDSHLAACTREPPASSNRESLLLCTMRNISSHSLTHYPYNNPT